MFCSVLRAVVPLDASIELACRTVSQRSVPSIGMRLPVAKESNTDLASATYALRQRRVTEGTEGKALKFRQSCLVRLFPTKNSTNHLPGVLLLQILTYKLSLLVHLSTVKCQSTPATGRAN